MTVLYIAGPMTGHDQHNYPAFFDAEEQLLTAGYAVLNPARIDDLCATEPGDRTWEWYMRRALRMVTDADGIALLHGWQDSRGATLEAHIAGRLELHAWPSDVWINDPRHATITGAEVSA